MKFLITRTEYSFAVVEANSEADALIRCRMGLVPESAWLEDDRPYEYSNDLGTPYLDDEADG